MSKPSGLSGLRSRVEFDLTDLVPGQSQERPGRIEYLYLTEPQLQAMNELDRAIDALPGTERLRCRNAEVRTKRDGTEFSYYPHADYDERTPPGPLVARLMCRTAGKPCPVQEQCLALALTLNPSVGVWGGVTFIDGVPQGITNNQEEPNGYSQD